MDSIRLEGMEEVSRAIKNIGDLNELDRALGKRFRKVAVRVLQDLCPAEGITS